MRRSHSQLYIHIVWGTWDRLDLIDDQIESPLYKYIKNKSAEHRCWLEQIGGTSNHIHVLSRITTSVTIGDYVQSLKGASSHYISQVYRQDLFFKWQGGYGAYSVSPFHVKKISQYILNQKQHHNEDTLNNRWEL